MLELNTNIPKGTKDWDKLINQNFKNISDNFPHSNGENILINGNFLNTINQRGKTVYNDEGYSIDRWRLSNSDIQLTVKKEFITLETKKSGIGCECEQFIEFPCWLSEKDISVSIKYRTKSNYFKAFVHSFEVNNVGMIDNNEIIKDGEWHIVNKSFKMPKLNCDNKFKIGAQFLNESISDGKYPIGETVDIEYIKLEIGDKATPLQYRNITIEELLCKRYFRIERLTCFPIGGQSGEMVDNFGIYNTFIPIMRTPPTVNLSGNNLHEISNTKDITVTTKSFNAYNDHIGNFTTTEGIAKQGLIYNGIFIMSSEIE